MTSGAWILIAVIAVPALGSAVVALVPGERGDRIAPTLGAVVGAVTLVLAVIAAFVFDHDAAGTMQLATDVVVGAGDRRAVPPGRRRHLAAARAAHRAAVGAVPRVHDHGDAEGSAASGVRVRAAAARGRPARHVRGARPDLVLPVLRDRADPDVVRDRGLGRRCPGARGGEHVHPLHAARLGDHGPRLPARACADRHVRPGRAGRRRRCRDGPRHAGARRAGDAARPRGQDPDVAAAHLAARRPHGGPDGWLGAAGRRAAEDGHVRHGARRPAGGARRRRGARALPRRARRGRHPLRVVRLPGPDRPQAPDRVLQRRAHGVRPARHLDAHARPASTVRSTPTSRTA